jgi:hypothetical protein
MVEAQLIAPAKHTFIVGAQFIAPENVWRLIIIASLCEDIDEPPGQ